MAEAPEAVRAALEAGRHTALMERLRTPCSELIALYDNGLIVSDGTVSRVIEEIRAALAPKENPDG